MKVISYHVKVGSVPWLPKWSEFTATWSEGTRQVWLGWAPPTYPREKRVDYINAAKEKAAAIILKYQDLLTLEEIEVLKRCVVNLELMQGILYPPILYDAPWVAGPRQADFNAAIDAAINQGALNFILQDVSTQKDRIDQLSAEINSLAYSYADGTFKLKAQFGSLEEFAQADAHLYSLVAERDELIRQASITEGLYSKHPLIFGLCWYHYFAKDDPATNFDLAPLVTQVWYIQQYGSEMEEMLRTAEQRRDAAIADALAEKESALVAANADKARMVLQARQDAAKLEIDLRRDIDSMVRDTQVMALLLQSKL